MSDESDSSGCGCGCLLLPFLIGAILYVCYVVICCSLLFIGVVAAIAGGLGLLWGVFKTTVNFISSVRHNLFRRSGRVAENAYVSFFSPGGDGFRNIFRTCGAAYRLNCEDMAIEVCEDSGCALAILLVFRLFQLVTMLSVTLVYLPMLCLPLVMLYFVIWIFYFVISIEMRFLEWSIIRIYGLFNLCKHCHRRVGLPLYKCPVCGAEHGHLISSVRFGPFFRRCSCGAYLPASRFFGRNRLEACCPHGDCGLPLLSQDSVPVTIAVIGGSNVGKSQFIMDMIFLLIKKVLPALRRSCVVVDEDIAKVNGLVRAFETGCPPQITQVRAIEAICIEMKAASWAFPKRLYLYDPPGESFKETRLISSHRYYEYMMGSVLIVDPFTLSAVKMEYARRGIGPQTPVGAMSPEDSLGRWLISVERDFPKIVGRSACAVVINKTDEPSFRGLLGLSSGASDAECRAFLKRCECANFISTVERSFLKCRFFAVASVGEGGNGRPFAPEGVCDVIKWLLENV